MDEKILNGINAFLEDYVGVQKDDNVILAYTIDSREPAAWVSVALEARGINTKRVWMEPLYDETLSERLTSVLSSSTELFGRLLVLTLELDTMSNDQVFDNVLSKYDQNQVKLIRATSVSSSFFANAFNVSPQEISARNTTILNRCMPAKTLRIETSSGTNLKVEIDTKRYRWISNRGVSRPGGVIILPSGEVATYPASIEGILIADFAFNLNTITDRDVRLHDNPITVWIENGKLVKYECPNLELSRFIDKCFQNDCAYNVGELGFGTNFGIDSAIPRNSHTNERRPGVHLGFGQHNQHRNTLNYNCNIHLDLIAKGGLVWIDNEPIPLDLENIPPSSQPHPSFYHEQDIYSPNKSEDCCGAFLTRMNLVN